MKDSRIRFIMENVGGSDEYPEELQVGVSCSGEATLTQVVQAFRMFLKGCEYSEDLVEEISYEHAIKNTK